MADYEERGALAGGCYKDGQPICVLRNEDYCDDGTWAAAHFLRATSDHELRSCTGGAGEVVIGRCANDVDFEWSGLQTSGQGPCSNHAGRCHDPSGFVEYDVTCTITTDLKSSLPTIYGKCGDRCVWSDKDCVDGEVYNKWDPACTSESVEIGSCFAGYAFCAISAEACLQKGEPFEPFLTHQETLDQIGVTCILSQLPSPTKSPIRFIPSSASNTSLAIRHSSGDVASVQNSNDNDNGLRLGLGAFAGLISGIAVGLGVLIGLIAYRMGIRSGTAIKVLNTTKTLKPMPSVEVEASSNEMEEISVLDE